MLALPFPLQRANCEDHTVVADEEVLAEPRGAGINVMDDNHPANGEGQGGGDNKE